MLAPFGFAELAFFFLFRRIRWQVWISFLVAAVPFLLWLPVLMRFRKLFGEHYWSKSTWSMALESYGEILRFPDTLALVLVIFLFVTGYVIISNRYNETAATSGRFLPHEVVLIMGLTAEAGKNLLHESASSQSRSEEAYWTELFKLRPVSRS